jgi:hypothetical protein
LVTIRLNQIFRSICLGTFIVAGLLSGCGGQAAGPKIAPVSGKVELDGQPLADALVEFNPESGRPAFGRTDADGRYSLVYSQSADGAAVGTYKVKITTGQEGNYAAGEMISPAVPEKLPEKYHEKSELTAEVKPGKNVIDFSLKSK